uniref:Allophycocyanin gamma subunit n=1 Tax=Porphyridium purpureum TaxID=35688 RepID=W0S1U6_PORPP|nr:allophycocyanin gamma subunit [Porphyridium purpureum]6KGX_VH Chain VH, Allophycocyanin gamma subunit [Porphyridium purpureum]6KGX_xH Chain xH, Allophycocyanin gamma subunit [Porphyridium purpureum]7EZX_VP Chain VP, Allophycocyanin gamma subunit [Porphyridium purpureum]7EZX_xP Chain xP, Allophycocyanin gamma subunit [Porphyridium purpureum]7Y4L_V3 Chain V3, Allophycocyanin gamma subunit [Porphyridium purpureum]7Y4L_x3 Chain x3, Allophycocyanin gamma subunit [Porphyridium purpureum]7Y5E_V3
MSLVTQVILSADDELRYPTAGELETISSYLKTGEYRIRLISILQGKEQEIIRLASKKIFQLHPEYIAPGGNASGARQRALCLRDYGWYLRLITYAILAGDKEPLEKIGIIGVREMYNSLGVPIIGMIDAIKCLKEATVEVISQEEEDFVAPYYDYIIQGMS